MAILVRCYPAVNRIMRGNTAAINSENMGT